MLGIDLLYGLERAELRFVWVVGCRMRGFLQASIYKEYSTIISKKLSIR